MSISRVAYAKVEGVQFEYFKKPVEITDKGVIFVDTKLIKRSDGTFGFEEIPNSKNLYKAESIIVSISQGPRNYIVSTTQGIETDERGLLVTDDCGRTTKEGIFASGDVVSGAKTVVEAVSCSKKVADAMEKYIQRIREN